jgi:hypothetical protein
LRWFFQNFAPHDRAKTLKTGVMKAEAQTTEATPSGVASRGMDVPDFYGIFGSGFGK